MIMKKIVILSFIVFIASHLMAGYYCPYISVNGLNNEDSGGNSYSINNPNLDTYIVSADIQLNLVSGPGHVSSESIIYWKGVEVANANDATSGNTNFRSNPTNYYGYVDEWSYYIEAEVESGSASYGYANAGISW